jgi:Uma2 family endonuclease
LGRELLYVPDLAGWRVERVPRLPNENPLTVVPDWVCEVLSPSTARDDRRLKLPTYLRFGVAYVWICDPDTRLLEVFAGHTGKPTLVAQASDETAVVLPPFDFAFDVARFWWPEEQRAEL